MLSVTCASLLGVSETLDTVPTTFPATSTWSPETIWLALWKIALTW